MSQTFQSTAPSGANDEVLRSLTAFCRSCGKAIRGTEGFCVDCGTSLAGPADESASLVGRTVAYKIGLRSKIAIVLADGGESLTLLVNDTVVETGREKVKEDWNRPLLVSPQSVASQGRSAAYRLLLATARLNPVTRQKVETYLSQSLGSIPARRSFALAALERNDLQSVRHSGLTATEQAWLLLWHHHDASHWEAAFEQLQLLPPSGYPDKLGFVASAWTLLIVTDLRRRVMAEHLAGIQHPLASLLGLLLKDDEASSTTWLDAPAPNWADQTAVPGVTFDAGTFDHLRLVSRDLKDVSDEAGPRSDNTAARILHALRRGQWRGRISTPPPPDEILSFEEPIVDSLIDLGLVGREVLFSAAAAGNPATGYLRARLSAGELSDDELTALGHHGEQARRLFLAGKAPATDGDGSTGSEYRVFELLRRLRDGDRTVLGELVPLLPATNQAVAVAVGRSLNSGTVDSAALVDRSTWPLLSTLLPSGPELAKAPAPVRRLGEWRSLAQAKQELFDWDWAAAAATARECLRLAEDEDVRDEALNLLACALYHQGNAAGSSAALRDALAGLDSPELIINYSIVAGQHDPLAASTELARLAMDAPTLDLRVTAAYGASRLWDESTNGPDGTDDGVSPPQALLLAVRRLSVEPTSLEDHRNLMNFLSWADDEWLADERNTKGSVHAQHPHHQYLVARAKGIEQQATALARFLRADPTDEWLARTRDELVSFLITAMDCERDEANLYAAFLSLELTGKKVPVEVADQILLPVLAVREIALDWMKNDREGYLTPELLDAVVAAEQLLRRSPSIEQAADYRELIATTVEGVVAVSFGGWAEEAHAIAGVHDEIVDELAGLYPSQINRQVVRQNTDPLLKGVGDLDRLVRLARQHVTNREMIDEIDTFLRNLSELTAALRRLPR